MYFVSIEKLCVCIVCICVCIVCIVYILAALTGVVQHDGMPLTVADYPLYPFTASAVNGNKQWSGSVNLRVESCHNAFGSLVLLIDFRVPAGGRFGAIKTRNQFICAHLYVSDCILRHGPVACEFRVRLQGS
jgi:hypothetical protein